MQSIALLEFFFQKEATDVFSPWVLLKVSLILIMSTQVQVCLQYL